MRRRGGREPCPCRGEPPGPVRAADGDARRVSRREPWGAESPIGEASGQMAVEVAVLLPVLVVVALLAFNVLQFAELCARFDRISLDSVLVGGVSPSGNPGGLAGVDAVEAALREAMGTGPFEVTVRVEDRSGPGGGAVFDLAAGTTRFVCELGYRPWPTTVEVAGARYSLPAVVRHERSIVVDRYRAGVVT